MNKEEIANEICCYGRTIGEIRNKRLPVPFEVMRESTKNMWRRKAQYVIDKQVELLDGLYNDFIYLDREEFTDTLNKKLKELKGE